MRKELFEDEEHPAPQEHPSYHQFHLVVSFPGVPGRTLAVVEHAREIAHWPEMRQFEVYGRHPTDLLGKVAIKILGGDDRDRLSGWLGQRRQAEKQRGTDKDNGLVTELPRGLGGAPHQSCADPEAAPRVFDR